MSRKRGLGRGLDALIPSEPNIDARISEAKEAEAHTQSQRSVGLAEVSIDAIQPNPHQPRLSIDDDGLDELAASIREHGLIQVCQDIIAKTY